MKLMEENKMGNSFEDDEEKMVDFWMLTKDEFLYAYSYLTEEDYDATVDCVFENNILPIN